MSLFGTSPDDPPSGEGSGNRNSRTKSSLFSDDPAAPEGFGGGSSSSLFNDDDADPSSPWDNPAPKRAARRGRELVKSLLPASDVPEAYIDVYDVLLGDEEGGSGGVSVEGVTKMMESTGLDEDARGKIMGMVGVEEYEENGLGRNEFNVLLALVGLALEGDDVTFDGVDERRKSEWHPR